MTSHEGTAISMRLATEACTVRFAMRRVVVIVQECWSSVTMFGQHVCALWEMVISKPCPEGYHSTDYIMHSTPPLELSENRFWVDCKVVAYAHHFSYVCGRCGGRTLAGFSSLMYLSWLPYERMAEHFLGKLRWNSRPIRRPGYL